MKHLLHTLLLGTAITAVAAPDFHKDVAPILREYCAGCHNDEELDGEFSVETFKSLMAGGDSGKAIAPGNAKGSLLLQQLTGAKKPFMPPRKEPQPSPAQIEVLKAWIAAGAPGPKVDRSILATLHVPAAKPTGLRRQPITAMAVSHGGVRALGTFGKVTVGKRTFTGHAGKVNALTFSADGNFLLAASGVTGLRGEAVLWNLKTGRRQHTFSEGHRDTLYGAALSPDGAIAATAGYDQRIQLWNTRTGKVLSTLEGHNGPIHGIAFSPDGTVLASAGGDSAVKLWHVGSGQRLDTFGQPTGEQFITAFTPDSQYVVAAGADKQIRLWRWISKTKPVINPLTRVRFAHEDEITDLALSRDGRFLASASADRTVKVWSLPALELISQFDHQPDIVSALAFDRTGNTLHLARLNGTTATERIRKTGDAITVAKTHSPRAIAEADPTELTEQEPNDTPAQARALALPAKVTGHIHAEAGNDFDLFRFTAKAGEQWVLEINAARSKSPLDSKLEVLTADGQPIERVRLQAVRDSWLTFRGKDSNTSGDFRLFKWDEMSLDQYLYVNGEVVKLWHYPRGPDSGYIVYPGTGNRHTFFDTTPLAHPLGQPAYIVQARAPGTPAAANGLPMFPIYFENDDESRRRWGKDSKLTFTAPADGDYLVRVSDVRGFVGKDFKYTLTVRPRRPNFTVILGGIGGGGVPKGSGREFSVSAQRIDDYEGPIRVDITDVPKGFTVTTPLIIEAGQNRAVGAVYAAADTPKPLDVSLKPQTKVKVTADSSKLEQGLVGAWGLNGNTQSESKRKELTGKLVGGAKFVDSPIGKQGKAISLDGNDDAVVIPRNHSMDVGKGEFTVAAWINPSELRQAGIVCLGRYNMVHGWYLDMPNNQGVLRIETINPENKFNGTVSSWSGVIRPNTWQHVAAVVRRGKNQTRLYVNGYEVGMGTIEPRVLDNPQAALHLGRIQDSQLYGLKGQIDEVYFYNRALDVKEIQALLEPGKQFVKAPPEKRKEFAKVQASATIDGKQIKHPVNNLANLKPLAPAKLKVTILTADGRTPEPGKPLKLTIAPGQTIAARVRIERNGIKERVSFGGHESGRNLPYGAYVDNIGLNGLLIVEGATEREFYITADAVTAETTRRFHLKAAPEGGILSPPVLLHVRKK